MSIKVDIGSGYGVSDLIGADIEARTRAVRDGLLVAAELAVGHLISQTPVDNGQLKDAWSVVKKGHTDLGGLQIVNDAPYAGVIEGGARPHPVSDEGWEAIKRWVLSHFPGMTDEEAGQFAQAITNKIAVHGQEPTHFVLDSLPELSRLAAKSIERALNRAKANVR